MFSDYLIDFLPRARTIVFFTGAGISAESGIATFRDKDGLWSKFSPTELASVDGFMSNPQRVWEWYQHRRQVLDKASPNPGHFAISKMQELFPNVDLITQNVDRLHQQAGSKDVIELHGNIITNRCFECSTPYTAEIDINSNNLPICQKCGGKIRPDVVWFGEMLPADAITKAQEVSEMCEIFFTIGTSAEVYPAANLPLLAKQGGAYVVEINPHKTQISDKVDECIRELSGVALPELLNQIGVKL